MPNSKNWVRLAVIVLLAVQVTLAVIVLHRESLTWDEGCHMYARYRMWKNSDYGLNPEHPPLVKLLATLPVLEGKVPFMVTAVRERAIREVVAWADKQKVRIVLAGVRKPGSTLAAALPDDRSTAGALPDEQPIRDGASKGACVAK